MDNSEQWSNIVKTGCLSPRSPGSINPALGANKYNKFQPPPPPRERVVSLVHLLEKWRIIGFPACRPCSCCYVFATIGKCLEGGSDSWKIYCSNSASNLLRQMTVNFKFLHNSSQGEFKPDLAAFWVRSCSVWLPDFRYIFGPYKLRREMG